MAKKIKGVVNYIPSAVSNRKGEQITKQTEAWKEEADCGCGIDCCNNMIVLKSTDTNEVFEITIVAGALVATLRT